MAASKGNRPTVQLDSGWRFQLDQDDIGEREQWYLPVHDFGAWAEITVPSAWDYFCSAMWGYEGIAWYAADVTTSLFPDHFHQRLEFQRVNYHAKVWLNGHYLGQHVGGDMPFSFDFTSEIISPARNILVVRVDNTPKLDQSPYGTVIERVIYGGIVRPVFIQALPDISIESVNITPELADQAARVAARISLQNRRASPAEVSLAITLDNGQQFSWKVSCPPNQTSHQEFAFEITTPVLWSPQQPHLYRADLTLMEANRIIDSYTTRFGIRKIEVKNGKILLNGEAIQIRGVNRYDEYAPYGLTVPVELVRKDLESVKASGFNLIRVHYSQEDTTLDIMDELGIMLMEEIYINWWGAKFLPDYVPPEENADAVLAGGKQMLSETIQRHYNHPCIVMWSVGNESATETPIGIAVFRELIQHAKMLDKTRLVTYAACGDIVANEAFDIADLVCANLYPATFEPNPIHHFSELQEKVAKPLRDELEKICRRFKGKPVIMSEYGTHGVPGIRGDIRFSEDMQAAYIQAAWKTITSIPEMQGGILWCWADYYHRRNLIGKGFMFHAAFGPFGLVTVDRKPKAALRAVAEMFGASSD
ncbi:MAG: glycoside hydrolase family 2 TIM barrel-domain containing protein [Anaerolineae bacterium]|nr:beta galactosidase jelly roll domain-containing protein [Candidatus Roseilinea sp.]MDW8450613.1 glycoside hydrolase family 2 TIM barrel-domain containing protein [Anaerolineae bacterium]